MIKLRAFLLLAILVVPCLVMAQRNVRDTSINMMFAAINYKFNLTGGDLNDRWGFCSTIGADVQYKFKNNLTVGLDGGFIFGNQLKEPEIFDDVVNSYGTITNLQGTPASVLFLMRGASANATIGYVWNRFGNNPNSGIWINGGFGYLMHKIRIESIYDDVPQLEGDYRKGYDRLTMGFASKQFIGYLYQADYRFLNFYVGFEFIQGLTYNVRNYNFDLEGSDPGMKIDLLHSVKFGWMIPIYKRAPRSLILY
jgi:hypothetical protein